MMMDQRLDDRLEMEMGSKRSSASDSAACIRGAQVGHENTKGMEQALVGPASRVAKFAIGGRKSRVAIRVRHRWPWGFPVQAARPMELGIRSSMHRTLLQAGVVRPEERVLYIRADP